MDRCNKGCSVVLSLINVLPTSYHFRPLQSRKCSYYRFGRPKQTTLFSMHVRDTLHPWEMEMHKGNDEANALRERARNCFSTQTLVHEYMRGSVKGMRTFLISNTLLNLVNKTLPHSTKRKIQVLILIIFDL